MASVHKRVIFSQAEATVRAQRGSCRLTQEESFRQWNLSSILADDMDMGIVPVYSNQAQTQRIQIQPKSTFTLPKMQPITGLFKNVIPGENAKKFNHLEDLTNTMREEGTTLHILLVGPKSTGKTMAAGLVSSGLERPFYPTSSTTMGSDLLEFIDEKIAPIHGGKLYSEVYRHPANNLPVYRLAPTTVFIDEAHGLSGKLQDALLVALEAPYTISYKDGFMDFRDMLLIMGTTDPSMKAGGAGGLTDALRSRCVPIWLQPYSAESVAKIVRQSHPHISVEDAIYLARVSKLVPRAALAYAKQCGKRPAKAYVFSITGADDSGIDEIDMLLLQKLDESVKPKNPDKVAEAEMWMEALERGEKVTPSQRIKAQALLKSVAPKPVSINALATMLQLTDDEVRPRVHYLQTLGLVQRTPQGVIRTQK